MVALLLGAIAIQYGAVAAFGDSLARGESWDVASRQARSRIDEIASSTRSVLAFVVVLLSAQLAPETRRNGTLQFVLSLGIGRGKAALAQLGALFAFLTVAVLLLHGGFVVAGVRTGALAGAEIAIAWIYLLLPVLALATAVFAISLTASAVETCLLFVGVPFVVRTIPQSLMRGYPRGTPRVAVHVIDNVGLFFPSAEDLVVWPHLSYTPEPGAIAPEPRYLAVHLAVAVAFWVTLGVWRFLRHDLGSRTALK